MNDYIKKIRAKLGHGPIIVGTALVAVVNDRGEILLQKRRDYRKWGLPGGTMDLGESLEETARREVREETNLECGALEFVKLFSGKKIYHKYVNGDEVYGIIALFKTGDYQGDLKVDEIGESLDLQFFSSKQVFGEIDLMKVHRLILEEVKTQLSLK